MATTITRQRLVNYYLSMEGTPWMHQGRLPSIGVDCVGMAILAARHFNLVPPTFDYTGYGLTPKEDDFREVLRQYMTELPIIQCRLGNMLTFNVGREQHVAFVTRRNPEWIIHAVNEHGIRRIVETVLSDDFRTRVRREFEFPGIKD